LLSPLRMPIGERLFRFTWLGPIGRLMLRRAQGRTETISGLPSGVHAAVSSRSVPASTMTPPPKLDSGQPPAALAPRLDALTARVEQLERWRDSARGMTDSGG